MPGTFGSPLSTPPPHKMQGRFTRFFLSPQRLILFIAQMVVSLPIFLFLKMPHYATVTSLLAWVMLEVAVLSWISWYGDDDVPVLPVILSLYVLYFALPIFTVEHIKLLYSYFFVTDWHSQQILFMALLSEVCIWIGWESGRKRMKPFRWSIQVSENTLLFLALGIVLFQIGMFALSQTDSAPALGNYSQVINGVANLYLALGVFYYSIERHGMHIWSILGITAIAILQVAVSVSSTMLGEMIMPFIVIGVLSIRRNKVITIGGLTVMIFIAGFLQPVKLQFRDVLNQFEKTGKTFSLTEKAQLYFTLAMYHASGAPLPMVYEGHENTKLSNRFSLLPLTAVLLDVTPSNIPFQYGATFEYLVYVPLPRFIYKDKPTAQEANVWFARSYGFLDEELAKTTKVGISHMGEVYVNFGWVGIIPVFLLVGLIPGRVSVPAFARDASLATRCIYVALIPNFLSIESTLTGFMASIMYTLVFSTITLYVLSRLQRVAKEL